ncbi:MAG: type VI secretion system tip protein TssI/VgrG [Bryobacteraceae bacterium]|nr:type VI secretion system tip protein TssI/VgrG [Bryobacteraceae bacterium]
MQPLAHGNSPLIFSTPLGADRLIVDRLQGSESISGLFEFRLDLRSSDPEIDFAALIGQAASVKIAIAAAEPAYIHGIVGRFEQGLSPSSHAVYHAVLHPWLWLLTLNSDCRIFQNLSVPEIIKQVFGDLGFADFRDALTGSYPPREYCVQYRETAYAFVTRLMEEEGIFFFFEHTASAHTLVLADDGGAWLDCPGLDKAEVRASSGAERPDNAIFACTLERQVTVGQYQSDDYNFETPAVDLMAKASADDPARSLYDYPAGYTAKDLVESSANRALTGYEALGQTLRGESTIRGFHAGAKFALAKHPRASANTEYVLRQMTTRADQQRHENSFEAFPASIEYRPVPRRAKPTIAGTQTAEVVGKEGEEIWTDKYGRVKVKFHWDQTPEKDENASCWIRVAQGWAGKQWGSFFLPRIGQEVVVSFLDGDPDRPLVTGCVYNAEQTLPYPLPAEQTKSYVKSNSSKGGAGFNEIRFEDKKGVEEIFIQAQKDLTTKVIGNEMHTVDGLTRIIRVNKGNEVHAVKGTRSVTVNGNEEHHNTANFNQDVQHGNYTLEVQGDITITATGNISIKADQSLKIEAGTTLELKSGTSLTAKAGTSLTSEAGTSLTNKAGTTLENNAGISLTSKASASQTVDGGGMLTLKGGLVKIN